MLTSVIEMMVLDSIDLHAWNIKVKQPYILVQCNGPGLLKFATLLQLIEIQL